MIYGRVKMKKKINRMILLLIILSLMVLPNFALAETDEVEPQDIGNPLYPGTNIEMQVGDVLYSPKSWSTYWVGHIGIVGTDFKVYHSHPESPYKFGDTIVDYVDRHKNGDRIDVMRSVNSDLDVKVAAQWAMNRLSSINTYDVTNKQLWNVADNYCSKFIWQAFYYTHNRYDITGSGLTDQDSKIVAPSAIKYSDDFSRNTYFSVVK
jgi:hypothetical protein